MIRRIEIYGHDWARETNAHGDYVLYDDHLVEIKALQEEITRLKSLLDFDLEDCK